MNKLQKKIAEKIHKATEFNDYSHDLFEIDFEDNSDWEKYKKFVIKTANDIIKMVKRYEKRRYKK